jgi:hypothetical protein
MATKVGKASHLNDAVIAATSFRVQTSEGNKEKKSAQAQMERNRESPANLAAVRKRRGLKPVTAFPPSIALRVQDCRCSSKHARKESNIE